MFQLPVNVGKKLPKTNGRAKIHGVEHKKSVGRAYIVWNLSNLLAYLGFNFRIVHNVVFSVPVAARGGGTQKTRYNDAHSSVTGTDGQPRQLRTRHLLQILFL
jgi:hypothetical protein